PVIAVLLLLRGGADRGERRVAEALARNGEREADVAARELDHAEHRGHVRAVARALGPGLVLVLRQLLRRCAASSVVDAVEQRGEEVELLRVRVLLRVVL